MSRWMAPTRGVARQASILACFAAVAIAAGACADDAGGQAAAAPPSLSLRDGWHLRSSADVTAGGAVISQPGFSTAGWAAATLPTTVLAALVKSGEVRDPYHGRNLEQVPTSRFTVPWWYRTELTVDEPIAASSWLVFHGINYSAEVWLNGEQVAGRDRLAGAFRRFELDVTGRLRPGKNALAVLVFPPQPGDFTVGFVDWNPEPPDQSMGLWREVELRRTGPLSLDDVFVRSDFDVARLTTAALTVEARLANSSDRAMPAVLRGEVAGAAFEHRVELAPREQRHLRLTPAEVPALQVRSPRLWWPRGHGEPHLYHLDLSVAAGDGAASDRQGVDFGIRKVADYLDEKDQRGYEINGKKISIRGGGWVDDLLLADDDQRLEDQVRYAAHLNLNTIRLEGFWGSTPKLYELADRYGLMVWVGWSCQWEWQDYLKAPVDETFGGVDTPAEMDLITTSLRDQVLRLRNHPSVVVWNLASDMLPRPELERRYRALLAEIDPTRPPLAACSVRTSEVSGPTGVKMNGPYEWVPPEYWYLDRERGGAYGFNTETGPGAQPPVVESIRRMLPREHWWPIDAMWDFHSGRHTFKNLDRYRTALDARYGASASLDEFARKAQVANYEAMRPMFESFAIRWPDAKGVVQWMLNSAWPDMFWQLYDWYLVPTGAYYAARNANQPLHVAYDYGRRSLVAINDTDSTVSASVVVRLLDVASRDVRRETVEVELAPGERREVVEIGALPTGSPVYFLDARLQMTRGEAASRPAQAPAPSFYWLPAVNDELDWKKSEWYYTPTRRYADLAAVTRLPPAPLEVSHRFTPTADGQAVEVTLHNPSPHLAFFVELAVVGAESGKLAAPVLWDDNYVSLLPGERRTVRGSVPSHALGGERAAFRYQGINVPAGG
jgi:exo-1,4-beta-D-glucosaminidase